MARVLVAEDEVMIRVDIVETLEEGGHTVVGEAGDGEQAVRMARELGPDLVVMDVKMPKVDGLTAARQITADGPAVPSNSIRARPAGGRDPNARPTATPRRAPTDRSVLAIG